MRRPLTLPALALVLLLALPVAAAQAQDLSVSLASSSLETTAGASASTLVTVTNDGIGPLVVRLSANNATGGLAITFLPAELQVLPGASASANLSVTGSQVGDWSALVVAQERTAIGTNGQNRATAPLSVRVNAAAANATGGEGNETGAPAPGEGADPSGGPPGGAPPAPSTNATSGGSAENASARPPTNASEPEPEPAPAPQEGPDPGALVVHARELDLAAVEGGRIAFVVDVENGMRAPASVNVTLRLPLGWGGSLERATLAMPSGALAQVRGEVAPARGARDAEGELEIVAGDARHVVLLRLRALPPPAPASGSAAGDASAPFAAARDASEGLALAEAASPPPSLRLVPAEISAPPGARVLVTLHVANPGAASVAGRARLDVLPLEVVTDDPDFVAAAEGETFVTFTVALPDAAAVGTEYVGVASTSLDGVAPAELRILVAGTDPSLMSAAVAEEGGAPILLAASLAGVGAGALALAAAWRRWPGLGLFPLYARLAARRALEHPRRARMLELLRAEPGLALADVQRRLGLSNGVARHHLALLEAAGVVRSVQDGALRRIWPVDAPRVEATPPLRERALASIRARGEVRASELAAELGVSRQSLHYHLKRLEQDGRIVARRDGGELLLRAAASSGSAR